MKRQQQQAQGMEISIGEKSAICTSEFESDDLSVGVSSAMCRDAEDWRGRSAGADDDAELAARAGHGRPISAAWTWPRSSECAGACPDATNADELHDALAPVDGFLTPAGMCLWRRLGSRQRRSRPRERSTLKGKRRGCVSRGRCGRAHRVTIAAHAPQIRRRQTNVWRRVTSRARRTNAHDAA